VTVYSEKLIWPPATKKVITKRTGGNAPKKEYIKVIFVFSFSFVKCLFIIKFKIFIFVLSDKVATTCLGSRCKSEFLGKYKIQTRF